MTPRKPKITMPCTYCGDSVTRYASQQINPKTGKLREIVKCKKCRRADPRILFWSKVDHSGGPDACWPWTGCKHEFPNSPGYFHGFFRSVQYPHEQYAHRFAFLLAKGPIPKGLLVLHKCPGRHNPLCCNPRHLELGTQSQNIKDMVQQGTHGMLTRPGELHWNSKLTEVAVLEILREYKRFNVRPLALKFGVSIACIHDVWQRRSWKHVRPPEWPDYPGPNTQAPPPNPS